MKRKFLFLALFMPYFFVVSCSKQMNEAPESQLHGLVYKKLSRSSLPGNTSVQMPSDKRGISYFHGPVQSGINSLAKARWYYNWTSNKGGTGVDPIFPLGARFVPMVWSGDSVTTTKLTKAESYGDTLLTFNEPDNGTQSNMTSAQALSYWPTLLSTNLKLSSPAVASNATWLSNFMSGAQNNSYRVDFVACHKYGGHGTAPDPVTAADSTIAYVTHLHNTYNKPVWLTETALTWDNASSAQQELAYMQDLLPQLENLSFVQRYCWYTMCYINGSFKAYSNLVDSAGNMTDLGRWYSAYSPNFKSGNIYRLECHSYALSMDNTGSPTDGSSIVTWGTTDSNNQLWTVVSLNNGYYKIINQVNNKALDNGGTSTSGAGIIQWTDNASSNYNQQWAITKDSYGWYTIKSRTSGMCLDINNATGNNIQLVQKPASGGWTQEWNFMIKL